MKFSTFYLAFETKQTKTQGLEDTPQTGEGETPPPLPKSCSRPVELHPSHPPVGLVRRRTDIKVCENIRVNHNAAELYLRDQVRRGDLQRDVTSVQKALQRPRHPPLGPGQAPGAARASVHFTVFPRSAKCNGHNSHTDCCAETLSYCQGPPAWTVC